LLIILLSLLLAPGSARAGQLIASVQDAAGKPVADAVVFIYETPGRKYRAGTAIMDQIDKELVPHVLPVLVGTRVNFPNKDNIEHHLYSFSKTKQFELPLYKGKAPSPVLMDKVGVVKLGCNIHDWMLGYIVVLDNPYFAKTDADGRADISGIPAGKYEVALWSERLKGSIDDTRQKVSISASTARVKFRPQLKPPRKPVRPPVVSY
jgi:plastocyanin